jgi:hypothetical protein
MTGSRKYIHSEDHRYRTRRGINVSRAWMLYQEHPELTPEQCLLCIAPFYSDSEIEEMIHLFQISYLQEKVLKPCLRPPPKQPVASPGRLMSDRPRTGRRVIRKGQSMS